MKKQMVMMCLHLPRLKFPAQVFLQVLMKSLGRPWATDCLKCDLLTLPFILDFFLTTTCDLIYVHGFLCGEKYGKNISVRLR